MNISWRQRLISVLSFIVESHIWLGLCAVMVTWGNVTLMQISINKAYLVFIFFGTLSVYNFHSYYNLTHNPIKKPTSGKAHFFRRNKERLLMPFVYISGLCTAITYLFLNWSFKALLLLPILISCAYVFPLIKNKRIKEWSYLKIFILTTVWTLLCFVIPMLEDNLLTPNHFTYILQQFTFFFALALPFDIRDLKYDNQLNITTLPHIIGKRNSQILASFSLIISASCTFIILPYTALPLPIGSLLLLSPLFLFILIWNNKTRKSSLFYPFYLDGILFFYGASILLSVIIIEFISRYNLL